MTIEAHKTQAEDTLAPSSLHRILLVDDEPAMVAVTELWLHARLPHAEITTTIDPHTGWELVQSGMFDTLIVDLNMPEIDGLEFIRRCSGAGLVRNLVLHSGESEDVLNAVRREHPQVATVQKGAPSSMQSLETLIRCFIDGHVGAPPV